MLSVVELSKRGASDTRMRVPLLLLTLAGADAFSLRPPLRSLHPIRSLLSGRRAGCALPPRHIARPTLLRASSGGGPRLPPPGRGPDLGQYLPLALLILFPGTVLSIMGNLFTAFIVLPIVAFAA